MKVTFNLRSGRKVTYEWQQRGENSGECEISFDGDIKPTSLELKEVEHLIGQWYATQGQEMLNFKQTTPLQHVLAKGSQN